MGAKLPEYDRIITLSGLFHSLADPTRLKIVYALLFNELCVHEIAEIVDVSISAVSHQLRLLKMLKLVKYRKVGKMIYYSLDDDHIRKLLQIADCKEL